jgi:uncharacterized protein YciI
MPFFIYCVDKPGHAHVRAANRAAHLEYLKGFADRVLAGGPTLTEDGTGMTGSVLLMDLPDRAAAEAFCAGDPYGKAGLFESVVIRPWKKVLPG